jgi:hypothetical protein
MHDGIHNRQARHAAPESTQRAAGELRPIAIARSYADLRRAIADWCGQIGMTREEMDEEAGLTSGHAGKILADKASRRLGIVTLGRVIAAAGLVMVLAIDPDAPPRPAKRGSNANGSNEKHWRRLRGTSWGRRMAAMRAVKLSPIQRSESARKAAQARWQRRGARRARGQRRRSAPAGIAAE